MDEVDAFAVDWKGFNKMAKEFLDLFPTSTAEEAENGFKAIGLAYLHLDASEIELHQAEMVVRILSRKLFEREAALLAA